MALPDGYSDGYTEHRLEHHSVVLLRGETWTPEHVAELRALLAPDVLIVTLDDGDTLEVLDEAQMRAAGWVRVSTEVPQPDEPTATE